MPQFPIWHQPGRMSTEPRARPRASSTARALRLGPEAVIEVTGLRNPCVQIERYQTGLLEEVLGKTPDGELIRRAGIMSVVLVGGVVRPGDGIRVELPAEPHRKLEKV